MFSIAGGGLVGKNGVQPISVNDITGTEYLSLRDAGWRISGAWLQPPGVAQVTVPKKGRVALAPPDPPKANKKPSKAKRRPQRRAKQAPKQSKVPSPQKRVPLSAEAMARLRSAEAFQLPQLARTAEVTPPRASFTGHIETAKINWNDESEDGSMWKR